MKRLVLGFLLVLGVGMGCKQEAGDRCQVDDDCVEGLRCSYVGTPNPSIGGLCLPPQSPNNIPLVDAAVDAPDDGSVDGAIDGSTDGTTDGPVDGAASD